MRALLSVYDKAGLDILAKYLVENEFELISTGGTYNFLSEKGFQVTKVDSVTGSPEILNGRVKTLHPKIHGGILAKRENISHNEDLLNNGIEYIDLVVTNLYPFYSVATDITASEDQIIENIDIGGPTLLRAAAKNFKDVVVLVDPSDYSLFQNNWSTNKFGIKERKYLAGKAFQHVAHYDTLISEYLRDNYDFADTLTVALTKVSDLRYGENPHQKGSFYKLDSTKLPNQGIGSFVQHHGKDLSYVNLLDADAAFNLVNDYSDNAIAIIKHTNPCCLAVGNEELDILFEKALTQGDAISAYGGIIATNKNIDIKFADKIRTMLSPNNGIRMFYEIVVCSSIDQDALDHLKKKSKDLRILTVPNVDTTYNWQTMRTLRGGILIQDTDLSIEKEFELVSERKPSKKELEDLTIAWIVCKHVKSNAITFVKDGVLVGMGAGQPNRVGSAKISGEAAQNNALGAAAASDALIPFPDTIEVCAEYGVTCLVHTGGSIRDSESIEIANKLNLSFFTSGVRHFSH